MRAIRAEFVARRGPRGWLWALLAGGLIAAAGLHWQARELRLQREAGEHEAQRMVQEASTEAARAVQAPLPYAESLAEIRKMRLVDWPQLLAALVEQHYGDWQGEGRPAPAPDFGDPVAPRGAPAGDHAPIGQVAVLSETGQPRSLTDAAMRPKASSMTSTFVAIEMRK